MIIPGQMLEAIMLICFGISWPIAIMKTLRSKSVKGTSIFFYLLVLSGYISGTIYKLFYNMDKVIIVYIINCCTVSTQILLYLYFTRREKVPAESAEKR